MAYILDLFEVSLDQLAMDELEVTYIWHQAKEESH